MQQDTNQRYEICETETNPRIREIRDLSSKFIISDDRAKEIELIDPVTISLFGSFISDTHEGKIRKLRKRANFKSINTQKTIITIYMVILLTPLCLTLFDSTSVDGSITSYLTDFVYFVYIFLLGWYVSRILASEKRIKIARRIMNAMIEEGLCLSCAYDICGLRVESDGCVVCPECGSAWRLKE